MVTRSCYVTSTDACGMFGSCIPESCLMRPVATDDKLITQTSQLDPYFDEKMGKAWIIEDAKGREAANQFLLDNGLSAIPEADSK